MVAVQARQRGDAFALFHLRQADGALVEVRRGDRGAESWRCWRLRAPVDFDADRWAWPVAQDGVEDAASHHDGELASTHLVA